MAEAPEVKTGFVPSGAKIIPSASGRVNTSHSFTGTFIGETIIYWADSRDELENIKAQWNIKIDTITQATRKLKETQDAMIRDKQRREETVQNLQEEYEKYVNDNRDQHIVLSYEEWCEENYPRLLTELAAAEEAYKKWVDEENNKAKTNVNTRNEEETVKAAETEQTSQGEETARKTPSGETQDTPSGPIEPEKTEKGISATELQELIKHNTEKYKITYPNFGVWAQMPETFPWVKLTAFTNYQTSSSARYDYNAHQGEPIGEFVLLLQNDDFGWNTTHKWEAYKGLWSPINAFKQGLGAAIGEAKALGNTITGGDAQIPYERFDTALIYNESGDRTFDFQWEFAPPPLAADSAKFWEFIRKFEEMTYSEKEGDDITSTGFKPPSLWNVEIAPPTLNINGTRASEPAFKWKLKHCACTKFGIKLGGIWQRGLPSKVTIDISFSHILPVFKSNGWWTDQNPKTV